MNNAENRRSTSSTFSEVETLLVMCAVWAAVADAYLRDQQQETEITTAVSDSGISAWRRFAPPGDVVRP